MIKKMTSSRVLSSFFYFYLILIFLSINVWGKDESDSEKKVYYEGDRVKIQQKKKIITIEGNAFIRKGTQGLKADKIIWFQNYEYAEAFDNVSFLDREQGVLYKGSYVKFLIKKSIVDVKGNPSIENRKDKIIIYANSFKANTKTGSIDARGNTRMQNRKNPNNPVNTESQDADYSTANNKIVLKKNAILKTQDQWFSADVIDIDQDKNFVILTKNVRIEDSPSQKKINLKNKNQKSNSNNKESNSLGDSILTCDRSQIFTETKYLECFGNVVLENKTDQTVLRSQYFLFNNPKNEILATQKVFFYKKNPTNERFVLSEYMKIYQKTETMYFTNDVVFTDIELGKTNLQLNCYSMKYLYAENVESEVECFKDIVLYNPEEKSYVYSDYMFYRLESGTGYVEKNPYLLNKEGNKDMYFYSQRIDLDRRRNTVKLNNDVLIIEEVKGTRVTNSTINCNSGKFIYRTINSNDTFTCFGDVDVYMVPNKAHFYGDVLTYYLDKQYSRLDDDDMVSFSYQKSSTNVIRGTTKYMENFHNLGFSLMNKKFFATETMNGRPINRLRSSQLRYHFLSQSNAFEGLQDVVFENLENSTTLYADYLFYNFNTDTGWAENNPVLINSDNAKNDINLVYADRINIDNKNNRSHLLSNIYIYKDRPFFRRPPLTPEIPPDQNYLNCEESFYYFSNDNRMFECVDNIHLVDRENYIDIYSDYMIYNLQTEYGFLKDDPYLISGKNPTNKVYVYSETMEFYREQGISLFHSNVFMEEVFEKTMFTKSSIECDDSKYVFGNNTNTLECFNNVVVKDYVSFYEISGNYLRQQIDEEYSFISGNPKMVWSGKGKQTVVRSDLFENFGKENFVYAKGNVKVDNGENQAESSLGIYDPKLKRFTLYGNPLVRDREGSEFTSEEVYFDVELNRMILGSGVGGNFIPDDFFE